MRIPHTSPKNNVAVAICFFLTICGQAQAESPLVPEIKKDSSKSESDRLVSEAWKRVAWHTLAPAGGGALFSAITAAANTGLEGGGAPFIIYGLLVGPSMGNVYLDDYSGAFSGGLSRLGGAAIGMAGLMTMAVCSFVSENPGGDNLGCYALGGPIMLAGVTVATIGTVRQLRGLPEAARNRLKVSQNNSENRSGIQLAILPLWNPKRKALGLNLVAAY